MLIFISIFYSCLGLPALPNRYRPIDNAGRSRSRALSLRVRFATPHLENLLTTSISSFKLIRYML